MKLNAFGYKHIEAKLISELEKLGIKATKTDNYIYVDCPKEPNTVGEILKVYFSVVNILKQKGGDKI